MATRTRSAGFTLVELLVALFAMALLAVMSWRGLDGMTRAQEQTQARTDDVLTLQVALAQWAADLDALIQLPQTAALDWNGRVLRITRRSSGAPGEGVVVAAWSRRDVEGRSTWLRWESAPTTTREQLERAWLQADLWSQNPGDEERRREVAVTPLAQWQIFYFRGGAWSHPLSSDATAAVPAPPASATGAVGMPTAVLPDGVRLVLTLPPGPSISGVLTRDWVRPTLSGGKAA